MQRKTPPIILFSFLFWGCAQIPEKPAVDLCTIDLPREQLICAPTVKVQAIEQVENAKAFVRNARGVYKIPLKNADKFVAFSPDDWAKVSAYAKTLREIVKQNCNQ